MGVQQNYAAPILTRLAQTPNLGFDFQGDENGRGIYFCECRSPTLQHQKFGQTHISPAPKYGGQTREIGLAATKVVGCAKPNLSVCLNRSKISARFLFGWCQGKYYLTTTLHTCIPWSLQIFYCKFPHKQFWQRNLWVRKFNLAKTQCFYSGR